MQRFIDTTTTHQFTSPLDKDEVKTIYNIAPLNSQEVQVVNDVTFSIGNSNGSGGSIQLKQSLRNRLVVQLGLRGWENSDRKFETEHKSILGLPKKDVITDDLLNAMPIDYVNSIGERIAELSLSTGISSKN